MTSVALPTPAACHPHIAFAGSACLDIVLHAPRWPAEDEEVRLTGVDRRLGGNAANSSVVAAGLSRNLARRHAGGDPDGTVSLIATITRDNDGAWVRQGLESAGVCTQWLIAAAETGLPTSYISLTPGGRTIFHHRSLREYDVDDFRALSVRSGAGANPVATGTGCDGIGPGPLRPTLPAPPVAAIVPCTVADVDWLHVEGRAVPATRALMSSSRGTPGGCLLSHGSRLRIVSLEVEKHRGDGQHDVERELVPLADVVFVSKAYCCGVKGLSTPESAVRYWEGVAQPAPASSTVTGPLRSPVVVIPWGVDGVWISAPQPSAADVPSRHHCHIAAHAPTCSAGTVVDTIGAGDAFVAAFCWAAATVGVTVHRPTTPTPTLSDWAQVARFAVVVAGEKCGIPGFDLFANATAAAAVRCAWDALRARMVGAMPMAGVESPP